ncbi:MAG: hypothetical protein WC450_05265 [Candidatus Omnitrophota bacterium]|jgi:hypothetical protein
MEKEKSCKARITEHLHGRTDDLVILWKNNQDDPEKSDPELGMFNEYGLGFDYVQPGTFNGQKVGYFRYQLGTGGPGDEFRFYTGPEFKPFRISYVFLDWFDVAEKTLKGKALDLLTDIWDGYFSKFARDVYDKSVEG